MSLVNLSHVCSHLQNASRARLGITSIPLTRLHLSLAHQLQKSGFISTVTPGSLHPPEPSSLLAHPPAPPIEKKRRPPTTTMMMMMRPGSQAYRDASAAEKGAALADLVRQAGSEIEALREDLRSAMTTTTTTTTDPALEPGEPPVWELMALDEEEHQPGPAPLPTNPAHRRLWLGLKYWNNSPVLSRMRMVSKPTRRIWMKTEDLAAIARGRRSGYVDGLRQVGECLYVSTDRGIMEVRECVERGLGGMLLCKVL